MNPDPERRAIARDPRRGLRLDRIRDAERSQPLTLNAAFAIALFSLGMLAGFMTARQPVPEPGATHTASVLPLALPSLDGWTDASYPDPGPDVPRVGEPMHAGLDPSADELEQLASKIDPSDVDSIHGPELPVELEEVEFEAPVALDVVVADGEIGAGENLSLVLNSSGVSVGTIHWLTEAFDGVYDFRRARPGHRFRIVQSRSGEVLDFRYQYARGKSIHLQATQAGHKIVEDTVGLEEAPDPLVALAALERQAPLDAPAAAEAAEALVAAAVAPAGEASEAAAPAPLDSFPDTTAVVGSDVLAAFVDEAPEPSEPSLADRTERYVPASLPPAPMTQIPETRDAPSTESLGELPFWRGDAVADGHRVIEGTLGQGDSLSSAMRAKGVSAAAIHKIDRAARPVFDFRKAQPGHRFRLVTKPDGEIVRFRYRMSSDVAVQLVPVPGEDGEEATLVATRIESPMRSREARIAGTVGSTLYEAIANLGEDPQLAESFANIFAWDLDFARNVQAGDRFQILYERQYWIDPDGRERFAQLGRILAASFEGDAGRFSAVYYEPDAEAKSAGARAGYYRPDGTAVERQFLAAPLEYSRIASRYTSSRFHPILKVNRPHHGIDYAAPRGTPIWAVASGKVVYRARAGSFGNLVKIEHRNGLISYYTHMQGFAKGLRVGDHVRQKQVIGYVGSTGLATGPHICFRVTRNGRYVNPLKVESPEAAPIPKAVLARFRQRSGQLMARLSGATVLAME